MSTLMIDAAGKRLSELYESEGVGEPKRRAYAPTKPLAVAAIRPT